MSERAFDLGQLLTLEYERLQASIDKFDDQRFKIRGWTVTVAGAFFAFGVNVQRPLLVAVGAVFVFCFFFLEVMFLEIQTAAIKRSNDVEDLIRRAFKDGLAENEYKFGIGDTFKGTFQWKSMHKLLRHREHVTLFYVGLMLLMVAGGVLMAGIG